MEAEWSARRTFLNAQRVFFKCFKNFRSSPIELASTGADWFDEFCPPLLQATSGQEREVSTCLAMKILDRSTCYGGGGGCCDHLWASLLNSFLPWFDLHKFWGDQATVGNPVLPDKMMDFTATIAASKHTVQRNISGRMRMVFVPSNTAWRQCTYFRCMKKALKIMAFTKLFSFTILLNFDGSLQ